MRSASLGLGLLLACCASQEPSTPSSKPANPQSLVDRGARDDARASWRWEAEQGGPRSSYLLGVVGQTGVQHCPEDDPFDVTWKDRRPMVGRVGVSGPPERIFERMMDRPVLVVGEPTTAPVGAGEGRDSTCGPIQARGDWRPTPRGIILERSPSPSIEHFDVTAIRPLHEVSARIVGEHVVIVVRNPVPVELDAVELRVHYEGCFPKPLPMAKTEPIGVLGVGAQVSTRMPKISRSPDAPAGRDRFVAHSVQIVASAESVVVDLDIPLEALGVKSRCPRRRGER